MIGVILLHLQGGLEQQTGQPVTELIELTRKMCDTLSVYATAACRRTVAALFLIPGGVLIGLLYLYHKLIVRDGEPVFHCGMRMGRNKKPFVMYKVRTLIGRAQEELQGKLHQDDRSLEIKGGGFIRRTRLDEIPQLINVLKGDMAFVGPRAVRPEVYERECRDIRNYDVRFQVLPGLTGLSQFMTPHGTHKAIRARIDNVLIRKMKNPLWSALIVLVTIEVLARRMVKEIFRAIRWRMRYMWNHNIRPILHRPKHISIRESDESFTHPLEARFEMVGVEDKLIHVASDRRLTKGEVVNLIIWRDRGKKGKRIKCRGTVQDTGLQVRRDNRRVNTYVMSCKPVSDVNAYWLERYVLNRSIN